MSVSSSVNDFSAAACPPAEPLYFESGARSLFGWLHWPLDGAYSNIGVVICKPFGYEAICAHRSVRAFAEACAALGLPTLRFDYSGTGDSTDIDPAADQIDFWTSDISAAVSAMRQRTGVERICLLGIRLGALLALLATSRNRSVDALILIAPILRGPRYLKDIRITRMASALLHRQTHAASISPGSLEISGFHLSKAAVDALQQADPGARSVAAVAHLLVIDGSSLPVSRSWCDQLAAEGIPITYDALPGMVEMAFTAPQFGAVPHQMVAAVRSWLSIIAFRASPASPLWVRPLASTAPALRLSDNVGDEAAITERPAFFGPDAALFGIVTEPRQGERRRRAVLMLNAGADVHTGPSGISVGLARKWAKHGYVVLRMDFSGLGDSIPRPGRVDNEVFPQTAVEDMRAAVGYLRGRYHVRDVTVAGMCSGAYHTLQSAIAALPVDRLLMVNPQNYFWNEGMSVRGMQVAELVARPAARSRLFSVRAWGRLLAGQVDIAYVVRRSVRSVGLALESALKNAARSVGFRLPNDLGRHLEDIARRGVRIVFVFARGEPGIDLLKIQAGVSLKRLGERVRMHIIDEADHVFSQLGPRRQLEQILSEELFTPAHWTAGPQTLLASKGAAASS